MATAKDVGQMSAEELALMLRRRVRFSNNKLTPEEWLEVAAVSLLESGQRAAEMEKAAWLVWSHEHGMWWRAGRCGYTNNINEAGRYSLEEALACCGGRDKQPDGTPSEIISPSPEWIAAREALRKAV